MHEPWKNDEVVMLATKVMGWFWDEREGTWNDNGRYPVAGWNPFEFIDDAFEVVAKLSVDGFPLEMKEQTDRMTWEPIWIARFGCCQGAEAPIDKPAKVIAKAALEVATAYYD